MPDESASADTHNAARNPAHDPAHNPAGDHATLVAALQRQLSQHAPTELHQTHISSVLLCGDSAYKLKRPVRLPFLDFSTPERRRHFLQEELRLNRRTAAPLYQAVLPITGPIDQPQIGGNGPPLDWVLQMRRFDTADEWAHLAARQALTPAHIDALAEHLHHFHNALPPCPADAEVADTAAWAAASFDELVLPQAQALMPWRAALDHTLRQASPSPAQRRANGWVRECHGDLHLGNIVSWQGQVMAFDALEFAPRLRHIDVIADLAFAFMDLLAHGLPALAWRLVNRHVEASGDFEGLRLLRGQAAYRALVRAKVAQLSGHSGNSGNSDARFSRYAALMRPLLAPPRARLVLCAGLSGSGKSTLALMLAEALGAMRVRSDVERKRLLGSHPSLLPPADLYSADATRRTYQRLGEVAHSLLAAQISVVVDAAALRQHERAALQHIAQAAGVQFAVVWCQAPEALMRQRIEARAAAGNDPSDATVEVLAMQQRHAEALPAGWAGFTHTVDNDGDVATLWAQAQALVAGWGGRDEAAAAPTASG